jgi:hypothetical protein
MKYRVSITVDAKQLGGLVDAAYSTPEFDPKMTIERIEEEPMRAASIAAAARRIKTRRIKVKHPRAVETLSGPYRGASDELAAWRNKNGGLHGWDRWLKTNHPEASRLLWPEWRG